MIGRIPAFTLDASDSAAPPAIRFYAQRVLDSDQGTKRERRKRYNDLLRLALRFERWRENANSISKIES